MATSGNCIIEGNKVAAADLSTKYGYAVKLNSSGNVAICDAAGEAGYGLLQNKPASGASCQVATFGEAVGFLAGTTAVGDLLTVDANGKLALNVSGSGAAIMAQAMEAGSASDLRRVKVLAIPQFTGAPMCIPITLSRIADGNNVTGLKLKGRGRITGFAYVADVPVSTGSKSTILNLEIGGTDLTGGVLTLTSALCVEAAYIEATAITAGGEFTNDALLDIEASSTTAFVEGSGVLLIWIDHR